MPACWYGRRGGAERGRDHHGGRLRVLLSLRGLGAVALADRPDAERAAHVAALRIPTEYITCLTRFGRVFFGLGQLVLALGLLQIALLPAWLAIAAAVLGVGAMALTMGLPDELERYRPVFHLNAAWLLAVGLVLLWRAPPM
jgi:hypothetical protein